MNKKHLSILFVTVFSIVGVRWAGFNSLDFSSVPDIAESIIDQYSPAWFFQGSGNISRTNKDSWYAVNVEPENRADPFGVAYIETGILPHKWYNGAPLTKQLVFQKDGSDNIKLICEFNGKRLREMETLNYTMHESWNSFCSIGITLWGDIGLDYNSTDLTKPHCMVVDIYFDTRPNWEPWSKFGGEYVNYEIGNPIDQDYRTQYWGKGGGVCGGMHSINQEYAFKIRVDQYIRDALDAAGRWSFSSYELKAIQCFIEVYNAKGSVEISRIDLGLPST